MRIENEKQEKREKKLLKSRYIIHPFTRN